MGVREDVTSYLATAGAGVQAVTLFIDTIPPTVDNALVVAQYPGSVPLDTHDAPLVAIERPRIQVLARGTDYVSAYARIDPAYRAMMAFRNVVIGGTRYIRAALLGTPGQLGLDDAERAMVAFNVEIWRATP